MSQITRAALVSILCAGPLFAACGGSVPVPASGESPAPGAAPAAASQDVGTITGRAPAAVNGVSAIVILKPVQPGPPAQANVPVMDQIALAFTPTILFAEPGQPTEFRNSDEELHNIRVMEVTTKEPAFNVALPTGGTYTHTFDKEGFYDIGCDIHPGMSAMVIAASTPFKAVAAPDGQFAFENVPVGDYTLAVYAGGGTLERNVAVRPGPQDLGSLN